MKCTLCKKDTGELQLPDPCGAPSWHEGNGSHPEFDTAETLPSLEGAASVSC